MEKAISESVLIQGAKRIRNDTLLIVDPSDITKKYAKKMQYLAAVRDAGEKKLGDGYWMCEVVGCATAQGIPLSQVVSEPAGGEIAAARRALEGLPLSGAVVTGDAMFAQRDLCRGISEKGGLGSSS